MDIVLPTIHIRQTHLKAAARDSARSQQQQNEC